MNMDVFNGVLGQILASLGGASIILVGLLKFYGDFIFKKQLDRFQNELKAKSDWFSALIHVELSKVQAAANRIDNDRSQAIKEIYSASKNLHDRLVNIVDFELLNLDGENDPEFITNYVGQFRMFTEEVKSLYAPFENSITFNSLFLSRDIAIEAASYGKIIFRYVQSLHLAAYGRNSDEIQFQEISAQIGQFILDYREHVFKCVCSLTEALRSDLYPEVSIPKR